MSKSPDMYSPNLVKKVKMNYENSTAARTLDKKIKNFSTET